MYAISINLENIVRDAASKDFESITPRISHCLNICVNPSTLVSDKVTDLTGMTNELLEHQPRFSNSTSTLISAFLNHLPQPVCIIAHNGHNYDFPLLKAEMSKIGEENIEAFIVDSLQVLRKVIPTNEFVDHEELEELDNLGVFDEDMTEDTNSKKQKLEVCLGQNENDEFEVAAFATPNKSKTCHPPRIGHSHSRRKTSELLSLERRKNGARVKKKLNFGNPQSYSLPLLHEFLYGAKPRLSHGASEDTDALIRVCAFKADAFVKEISKNYSTFTQTKRMW